VAARITNRRYIGYDIDEHYVQIARDRAENAWDEIRASAETKPRAKGAAVRRSRTVVKVDTTALVGGDEVRDREVRVGIQEGEVLLGIKTVGAPDLQKQNLTASLPVADAQRIATALLKAAESLTEQK
jgi:hypothetical protein